MARQVALTTLCSPLIFGVAILVESPGIALAADPLDLTGYYDYLPGMPMILGATDASREFERLLYGDARDLQDVAPVDGIDDRNAVTLLTIAERFSPVLYKNNYSLPRAVEAMLRLRYDEATDAVFFDATPVLHVDTWDRRYPSSKGVLFDSIVMDDTLDGLACGESDAAYVRELGRSNDAKLLALLEEFNPNERHPKPRRPECDLLKALYFDMPGHDEESWKKIYKALARQEGGGRGASKIYAHVFLVRDASAPTEGFELVVQYWFFYPFNDGGNNHEGDWEHVNVVVTTDERGGTALARSDVERILGQTPGDIETLRIKRIDYYFHHFVMTLDYFEPGIDYYGDKAAFEDALDAMPEDKINRNWIRDKMYDRLHGAAGSAPGTHPVAFIGADNMGLDQLMAAPGEKNRNSHGTYPFEGIWKHIGPVGATERINEKDQYATYAAEDIILLPDWERVHAPMFDDDDNSYRSAWSWLVLPVWWGFPISASPGGTAMKGADLGQVAPPGPAYNGGWNRVGECQGFERYDPNMLTSGFQLGAQDDFKNDYGFLNGVFVLFNAPPLNIVKKTLQFVPFQKILTRQPKFSLRSDLPFRFLTLAWRPTYAVGNDDFAQLLPGPFDPDVTAALPDDRAAASATSLTSTGEWGLGSVMFNIHIGRFSGENAYAVTESDLSYTLRDSEGAELGEVSGKLRMKEFTGSLRHSLTKGSLQPFVRAGYSWSWYKATDLRIQTVDGTTTLGSGATETFHTSVLPNTWHFGTGLEFFYKRNPALWEVGDGRYIAGLDFGARVDYTLSLHKLGKEEFGNPTVARHAIGVGALLSF